MDNKVVCGFFRYLQLLRRKVFAVECGCDATNEIKRLCLYCAVDACIIDFDFLARDWEFSRFIKFTTRGNKLTIVSPVATINYKRINMSAQNWFVV